MLIEIPDELYADVEKLIKDKGANHSSDVKFDIATLIDSSKTNLTKLGDSEYWGGEVTVPRNWKSSPDHPDTFLAYITVQEAKMLRHMGLGYSFIHGEYRQHFDINGIPSFNGYSNESGDGDYSDSGGGGTSDGGGGYDYGGFDSPDYSYGTEAPSYDAGSDAAQSMYEQSVAEVFGLDHETMLSMGYTQGWGMDGAGLSQLETYGPQNLSADYSGMVSTYGMSAYDPLGLNVDQNTISFQNTVDGTTTYGSFSVDGSSNYSMETYGTGSESYSGVMDGIGYSYDYNEGFFMDTSVTTYGAVDPVTGRFTGQVNRDRAFTTLGTTFSVDYDVHFNTEGVELGLLDEAVADVLEAVGLDVSVDAKASSAIQSVTNVMLSMLGGVPTAMLGRMAMAANIAKATADTMYANNSIGKETRDAVGLVGSAVSLFSATVNTIDSIRSIAAAREYGLINTPVAAIAVALSAVNLGIQVNAFTNAVEALGIKGTPTLSDVESFNSSMADGEISGNATTSFKQFAEWYQTEVEPTGVNVNSVQESPYEYMAGGQKYDSKWAGNTLYHPSGEVDTKVGVRLEVEVDEFTKHSLFQEGANYQNLEQVNTKVDDIGSSKIGMAKTARYRSLIESRNALISTYTAKTDAYNSLVTSFNTAVSTYNAGTRSAVGLQSIEAQKVELDTQLSILNTLIESLVADIESIDIELEDLVG